jgi:hypothetical protein
MSSAKFKCYIRYPKGQSPPPSEARSPPSPRRTTLKEAVTDTILRDISYLAVGMHILAVVFKFLQLQAISLNGFHENDERSCHHSVVSPAIILEHPHPRVTVGVAVERCPVQSQVLPDGCRRMSTKYYQTMVLPDPPRMMVPSPGGLLGCRMLVVLLAPSQEGLDVPWRCIHGDGTGQHSLVGNEV